jgi:hypothetical protein
VTRAVFPVRSKPTVTSSAVLLLSNREALEGALLAARGRELSKGENASPATPAIKLRRLMFCAIEMPVWLGIAKRRRQMPVVWDVECKTEILQGEVCEVARRALSSYF